MTLDVDDAYLEDEEVTIRAHSVRPVGDAVLLVEEQSSKKIVRSSEISLRAEGAVVTTTLGRLPQGTYRVALQLDAENVISDVFIVSR